jgi:hypothetical protein
VALYYGAIVLLALTWVFFSMRLGVRIWRKAFGMDDWLMLVGSVRHHHNTSERGANTTLDPLLGYSSDMYCLLLLWIWPVRSICASPDLGQGHQSK